MSSSAKKDLLAELNKTYQRFQKKTEEASMGGGYLPLSVWIKKGYDGKRIAERSAPEDFRECPVLGPCCRVPLVAKMMSLKRGIAQADTLQGALDRQGRRASARLALPSSASAAAVATADAAPAEPDESSDETTVSESSLSSNASGRTVAKHAKAQAAKKAKRLVAKAKAKAKEIAQKADVSNKMTAAKAKKKAAKEAKREKKREQQAKDKEKKEERAATKER